MKLPVFLLTLLALFLTISSSQLDRPAKHIRVLTDRDFEFWTQAATGATTGDWLVAFLDPDCPACQNFYPHFLEATKELQGKKNVAIVNPRKQIATLSRFQVKAYPTLLLLTHGEYTVYDGPLDNVEAILLFTYTHQYGEALRTVPPPPPFWMNFFSYYLSFVQEKEWNFQYAIFGLAIVVGTVFALTVYFLARLLTSFLSRKPRAHPPKKITSLTPPLDTSEETPHPHPKHE